MASWSRRMLSMSDAPEFTLSAVLIGLAIGCLLCFTNLYFGLQTGFISMMSLQSALIGYLISKMLPTPLTPQQIIVVQTTAAATGTMPLAAGFVGILPALSLLEEDHDGSPPIYLTWIAAIGWSLAIAFFGVFLSPPLRKQVIIEEKLAFPSGTATAHLISALHNLPPLNPTGTLKHRAGYQAIDAEEEPTENDISSSPALINRDEEELETSNDDIRHEGWSSLIWSFAVSSLMTLLAYFFPVVFSIPLFGSYLAREWAWTFTPSLSYVGQGIIMGLPTTLSMNLGMFVGWAILSPISKYAGWAPGPVNDMTTGPRGWILWVSLAIMCSDSLISLLPVIWESVVDVVHRDHSAEKESEETETDDRLVPISWVLTGCIGSVVVGTILVWVIFGHEGIKPWATFIGFLLGGLLSILGVRALGETDINPVSGLGKISQLFFAWIQPGNVVANIIAGGVAEAGAMQAGELMQDLKTGHLLQASPRAQFFGQLAGSSLSIFVSSTAYIMYTRAYEIPGPSFPAPTAYVWLSMARLLRCVTRNGNLPDKISPFMVIFAIIFSLISAFKAYATRQKLPWAKWIPSGVAFAIGFLNTPSFSIARLLGGIAHHVYQNRFSRSENDIRLIVIASGFVLGEGVTSVVSLIFRTFGIGVASCWGCSHGMCGSCS